MSKGSNQRPGTGYSSGYDRIWGKDDAQIKKCTCVYATSRNTASVRKGYEMGGYVKELCDTCKAKRN